MERSEAMTLKGLGLLFVVALALGVYIHLTSCRFPPDRIGTTEIHCRLIKSAVFQWQIVTNDFSRCPQMQNLIEGEVLDPGGDRNDAWSNAYRIACVGDGNVIVSSAGQDATWGSPDDISTTNH